MIFKIMVGFICTIWIAVLSIIGWLVVLDMACKEIPAFFTKHLDEIVVLGVLGTLVAILIICITLIFDN